MFLQLRSHFSNDLCNGGVTLVMAFAMAESISWILAKSLEFSNVYERLNKFPMNLIQFSESSRFNIKDRVSRVGVSASKTNQKSGTEDLSFCIEDRDIKVTEIIE